MATTQKKPKTVYICQSCSNESPRWVGQCPICGEWNSLVETLTSPVGINSSRNHKNISLTPVKLSDVKPETTLRESSNILEFDRVLGGGFVKGQVILLSGDPGIGKSTLLTQIARELKDKNVLYVCGEESYSQVKIRASRMNYNAENLLAISETDVDIICSTIENTANISLVIVDSIQTLQTSDLTGTAGSVGQIRECANKLAHTAKLTSIPLIIVGHVTKDGTIAGPKVLEHMVDTVLYIEGDSQHLFRMLKTTKNRFGPVSEIGVFEMASDGMHEVTNPSELFLSERIEKTPGTCVTVTMEGMRPLLFEIQALTTSTSFGYPRRTASGFNTNRLNVLIAILEKHCKVNLSNHDVFINVAGGYKVDEYACDLAVCLAIVSSLKNIPLSSSTVAYGEVGLSGEIRKVSHEDKRVKEAKKLGYNDIINPTSFKSVHNVVKRLTLE